MFVYYVAMMKQNNGEKYVDIQKQANEEYRCHIDMVKKYSSYQISICILFECDK